MRPALALVILAASCGGSQEPAPPAPPAERYLPSEPITSNEEPPVAAEKPPAPSVPQPQKPRPPAPTALPADGVYSPRIVRANSTKLLDQRITVKGTVVWIYDCVAEVAAREPDKSREEIEKLVAKHPDQCKRPHFYLGDRKGAPVERAIQVVEVPRPMRPDEKISLSEKEIAAWPAVPSIALGQVVTVEGKWALSSPKGYANKDGLLVYGRLVP
jgi:hypothetical protein